MERIYKSPNSNGFKIFARKLSITNWIIAVNFIVFLVFAGVSSFLGERAMELFALQANSFFSGKIWTLITSMFLHANLWHLFFNMISLFFIGNFVEKLIGRKRFLIFYILSGIFAGLFYVFLSYFFGNASLIIGTSAFNIGEKLFLNPEVYAVGASGAIFALIGVLAVLTPYNKVYLLLGPLMAIILQAVFSSVFPESAFSSVLNIFVTIYFLVSIFSIISFNPLLRKIAIPVAMQFWILPIISIVPLMIIGLFVELPIGNTAHLGGLITGIFYAVFLRKKYKRKTEMIRNYFR